MLAVREIAALGVGTAAMLSKLGANFRLSFRSIVVVALLLKRSFPGGHLLKQIGGFAVHILHVLDPLLHLVLQELELLVDGCDAIIDVLFFFRVLATWRHSIWVLFPSIAVSNIPNTKSHPMTGEDTASKLEFLHRQIRH